MNKHLDIGPGGTACACCFPAPGTPDRRAKFRTAKRREQRAVAREIEMELVSMVVEDEELRADADAENEAFEIWLDEEEQREIDRALDEEYEREMEAEYRRYENTFDDVNYWYDYE